MAYDIHPLNLHLMFTVLNGKGVFCLSPSVWESLPANMKKVTDGQFFCRSPLAQHRLLGDDFVFVICVDDDACALLVQQNKEALRMYVPNLDEAISCEASNIVHLRT